MKGDKEKIDRIKNIIDISIQSENSGLFITLVGLPEGMTPSQYNEGGWWDANISHWGTKWDITPHETDFSFEDESIGFCCDTAWSPPIPFCQKVAEMFGVEVHITYEEGGVGFAGETFCYPDGTIDDREYEYNEGVYIVSNSEFWDSIVPNTLECYQEEGIENIEEKIEKDFHFCTENEIKSIIQQYKEEYND